MRSSLSPHELFVFSLLPPVFTLTMLFKQMLLLSAALLAMLAALTFGASPLPSHFASSQVSTFPIYLDPLASLLGRLFQQRCLRFLWPAARRAKARGRDGLGCWARWSLHLVDILPAAVVCLVPRRSL